jgi:hypothetical protein
MALLYKRDSFYVDDAELFLTTLASYIVRKQATSLGRWDGLAPQRRN